MTKPTSPNRPFVVLGTGALVVMALYFGRPLLAPLAVAVLLVFLLAPVVEWLQRHGLPGPMPVVLVMLISIGAAAGVGVLVAVQAESVLEKLPAYESNIRDKLAVLRSARRGPLSPEAQQTLTELGQALEDQPATPDEEATPVTVVEDVSLTGRLAPLLDSLASAGLAVMLAAFILAQRRALRDRIVHMFGRSNLSVMTHALDEAGERISRYLLAQGLVNLGFGVAISIGLYVIGVDFALLWGLLGALLRFIPYIGPWLAAAFPAALSLAVSPGWTQPLLVIGLFAVVELIIYAAVEPVLYGRSAGISPVALVVAIAFWTLLWGPVGLFVGTPLTVCLLVLCRHVPQLAFIAFLLGNEPAAPDDAKYYQRLLAHDEDEALQIALEFARTHQAEEAYDGVLLPAVSALKADLVREGLDHGDLEFGLQATRHIVEALDGAPAPARTDRPVVLGCPASDELDVLALGMLRQLMRESGQGKLEVLGSDLLVSEVLAQVEQTRPALVCVGALAPGGLARAQLLCRRLRALAPETRIVVGRWQSAAPASDARLLGEAGADRTSTSLLETRRDLDAYCVLAPPA
ncbi:MAG TPA: AI-2E family transporter [Planctomycetota bacterium]|nr:AI-2E family transporter [Planctomycetota bacterium]